jgi:hypothetical protein
MSCLGDQFPRAIMFFLAGSDRLVYICPYSLMWRSLYCNYLIVATRLG